jgi:hypothetical protein
MVLSMAETNSNRPVAKTNTKQSTWDKLRGENQQREGCPALHEGLRLELGQAQLHEALREGLLGVEEARHNFGP